MRPLRRRRKTPLAAFVLAAPGILLYILVAILPLFLLIYYSFTDWNGFSDDPEFVGLANYQKALGDGVAANSVYVTVMFAVVSTIVVNVLGLLLAHALNHRGRLTLIYRTIVFFPTILSGVVIGFLWKALLSYNGPVNNLLAGLGLDRIVFLGEPQPALWTMIFIGIWQGLGFTMVIYLAALQGVSADLKEAALLDGANAWERFLAVTLPAIAPAVTINILINVIGGLKLYDLPAVVTGGGPARSTETLTFMLITEAFTGNRFGYAAALGILFTIVFAVLSIGMMIFLRRREERSL